MRTKKINTKNLTDKDAEITFALENLYNVCEKYNATMFARIILNDKKFVGAYCVKNAPLSKQQKDCKFLIDLMDTFVRESSNNKIRICND